MTRDPIGADDPAGRDVGRAEALESAGLRGAIATGGLLVLLAWPVAKVLGALTARVRRRRR